MFRIASKTALRSIFPPRSRFDTISRRRQSTQTNTRHLLSISDLSPKELKCLVRDALKYKSAVKNGTLGAETQSVLQGRTVAMIFNKRSTRTRISTEGAVSRFGGHPMFLGKDDIQLGVNESLRDTATVLSSMTSAIFARVGPHSEVDELSKYSTVPIINSLSDTAHPLQAIADLLTIHEEIIERLSREEQLEKSLSREGKGDLHLSGLKLAWVGDANNVLYDLAIAAAKLGLVISVATPKDYGLPSNIKALIESVAKSAGHTTHELLEFTSPAEAIHGADFIFTDTWVSMGQEREKNKRLKAFSGFQINNKLINTSKPKDNWRFMHCLPRHIEEVDNEVFYGPHSLVFREAENRLYAAMAVLQHFVVKNGAP